MTTMKERAPQMPANRCQPGEHDWLETVGVSEYERVLDVWVTHHRKKTCRRCGEVRLWVDHINELHAAIGVAIAESPRPIGLAELRFARSLLRWRSSELAKRIGVARATVSRWESEDVAIPAYAQIAIKLFILLEYGRGSREVQVKGPRERILMRLVAGKWVADDFSSLNIEPLRESA